MFCINCGKEINDKAKFCPYCGSENTPVNNDLPNKKNTPESEQTNVLPKIDASYNNVIPKQVDPESDSNSPSSYSAGKAENTARSGSRTRQHQQVQAKQNTSNKGLKTIFFILLAFAGILVVLTLLVLFTGNDAPVDFGSIIESDPAIEDEVRTEWDKGVYSIYAIGSESTSYKYDGVWQLAGMKANITDTTFTKSFDDEQFTGYIVIDSSTGMIHSVILDSSESVLEHTQVYYEAYNDELYSEGGDDIPEDARLKYIVIDDVLCVAGAMGEGIVVTEWAVYEKANYSVDYMLNLAASIQETETIDQNSPASNDSFEIEQQILGAWESNLENIGIYYGCVFASDGSFRYLEIHDGVIMTDTVYSYDFTSPSQMILGGNGDVYLDAYIEHDGPEGPVVLYLATDTEIIALEPVDALTPPSTDTAESAHDRSDDIVAMIEGRTWVSTGNEYDNEYAVEAAAGYPKTYDVEYGELVYSVNNGIITTSAGTTTEYDVFESNEIIKAFSRIVNIDNTEHEMYSVFFIEGGYLYEIEMLDDNQVSNIIELEAYEP